MTTHVLMITDQSGSMAPVAGDVIDGFNGYLTNLEEDASNWSFTSILFNTQVSVLCEAAEMADVPRLNQNNYRPGGFTALLDAVFMAVTRMEQNPAFKINDKVLVVTQTDGMENASREATFEQVRELIQRLEATGQWSFIFIGQGPDSWLQGERMGYSASVNTTEGKFSTRSTYGSMGEATRRYAGGQSASQVSDFLREEHRKSGTLGEDPPSDK